MMRNPCFLAALAAALFTLPALAAQHGSHGSQGSHARPPAAAKVQLWATDDPRPGFRAHKIVYRLQLSTGGTSAQQHAFFYRTSMATDLDGYAGAQAPPGVHGAKQAYDSTGVAWTKDRSGKPTQCIQKVGDPFPGFYVSKSYLEDLTVRDACNPKRYVDAWNTPYVVLPPALLCRTDGGTGKACAGDFAVVVDLKTHHVVHAIVGDKGPRHALGEASAAVIRKLNPSDWEGGDRMDLAVVVFPGTKKTPRWPVSHDAIETQGRRLFDEFGGLPKLLAVYPDAAH